MNDVGERMHVAGADGAIPVVRGTEPFDVFYRREYAACVQLAYVLSGSHLGAEDLAQDAFVEAHRRWKDIGSYENPGAWVRRVIANRAVSSYRRRMAETRALTKMVVGWRSSVPELAADSDEIWRVVRRLPRRQAQVVALTYLEELSHQEIAVVLGISVPTVGTHLQRARRSLAKTLDVSEEASQ